MPDILTSTRSATSAMMVIALLAASVVSSRCGKSKEAQLNLRFELNDSKGLKLDTIAEDENTSAVVLVKNNSNAALSDLSVKIDKITCAKSTADQLALVADNSDNTTFRPASPMVLRTDGSCAIGSYAEVSLSASALLDGKPVTEKTLFRLKIVTSQNIPRIDLERYTVNGGVGQTQVIAGDTLQFAFHFQNTGNVDLKDFKASWQADGDSLKTPVAEMIVEQAEVAHGRSIEVKAPTFLELSKFAIVDQKIAITLKWSAGNQELGQQQITLSVQKGLNLLKTLVAVEIPKQTPKPTEGEDAVDTLPDLIVNPETKLSIVNLGFEFMNESDLNLGFGSLVIEKIEGGEIHNRFGEAKFQAVLPRQDLAIALGQLRIHSSEPMVKLTLRWTTNFGHSGTFNVVIRKVSDKKWVAAA